MLAVEDWAEIRRLHLAEGWSIKRIVRERGFARNTVRAALRAERPLGFRCGVRGSKLDAFKGEIERLLGEDGRLPGEVILAVLREQGYGGGRSILHDHLREVRPRFAPPRSTQRMRYEPGELCQFDLWHPSTLIPVGHEQQRAGYVVVATLGYSRAAAAAVVFSKEAPDLLWGISRCLWRLGGLPRKLVWDREGALHGGLGRPSDAYARLLGELGVGGVFCRAGDPQAKGVVERFQGYLETSFEPGRSFVNEHDYQAQLDRWIIEKANQRLHRALRARPAELLVQEQRALRALPATSAATHLPRSSQRTAPARRSSARRSRDLPDDPTLLTATDRAACSDLRYWEATVTIRDSGLADLTEPHQRPPATMIGPCS